MKNKPTLEEAILLAIQVFTAICPHGNLWCFSRKLTVSAEEESKNNEGNFQRLFFPSRRCAEYNLAVSRILCVCEIMNICPPDAMDVLNYKCVESIENPENVDPVGEWTQYLPKPSEMKPREQMDITGKKALY